MTTTNEHQSDCMTNGFDMPGRGVIVARHCSCGENEWLCPRCGLRRTLLSDIAYVEHWCADGEIQSLNAVKADPFAGIVDVETNDGWDA